MRNRYKNEKKNNKFDAKYIESKPVVIAKIALRAILSDAISVTGQAKQECMISFTKIIQKPAIVPSQSV